MPKYRKHVVDVEAFQLTAENYRYPGRWPQWFNGSIDGFTLSLELYELGYWVIRGIDNHIHIMDPETFATTYVEVPDA